MIVVEFGNKLIKLCEGPYPLIYGLVVIDVISAISKLRWEKRREPNSINAEVSFTGIWSGSIALQAAGEGGFGYDPVFVPEGFSETAAELDPEVKNSMSHRFLAMQQMAGYLEEKS